MNNNNNIDTKSLAVNSETIELKQHISLLQNQIAELTERRDDLKKQILEFDLRYNARVGSLVQQILHLRMQKAKHDAEADQSQAAWYQETVADYQEYTNKQQIIREKKVRSLNDEDLGLIKSTFRRAARQCHPDTAPEAKREQYQALFIELRQAYEINDLEQVLDIHERLKQDKLDALNLDKVSDLDLLRKKYRLLDTKKRELEYDIAELLTSETFEIIQTNTNLDNYFDDLEKELKEQLAGLRDVG